MSRSASRRRFLQSTLGVSLLTEGLSIASEAQKNGMTSDSNQFREPEQTLPLHKDADVIICGAGPAGVSAAIAAGRAGAKVRLFEMAGCLGGVWTAGLLTWIFDFDKPGLAKEIREELEKRDARRGTHAKNFVYEPDEMKLLLEDLCTDAGVNFRLQTRVVAAYKESNRLTTIVTESRSGREAWQAPVFIDATGDGTLGSLAGCQWSLGNMGQSTKPSCECQPLTMNALVAVKDASLLQPYTSFYGGDMNWHVKATENFKAEIKRAGIDPSYGMPTIFHIRDNVVLFMINHEYGIRPDDADAMTAATVRARKEIHTVVKALRKLGGVWEQLQVVATAEQIGIRDGKRIAGRYEVTSEDLIQGARHDDAVAHVTFGVDIHAFTKKKNDVQTIERGNVGKKFRAYDIPLRALIAKDVDALMMAGRCISGDFVSHASYRVTGNAVAMGEYAGATAAVAAAQKQLPQNVLWADVTKSLEKIRRS